MTVAILDTVAAVQALAPEWQALWARTEGATPFQSPLWLLPWWSVFGTDAPLVATWREAGVLAGVLPVYVLTEVDGRKLLPIGAGTTDYLDALGDGVPAMVDALLDRAAAEEVGRCDLVETPPFSRQIRTKAPPGWRVRLRAGGVCPVLAVPGVPAKLARNLRLARNRSMRAGGWTIEEATPATLDRALAALRDLHGRRWSRDGQAGVMADPAVAAFHAAVLPGLLAAGLMRLPVLRIAGEAAAAALLLLDARRLSVYLTGYDPARGFESPGTLLLGSLIEGETREVHFLRGQEGYKYAWGAVDRVNTDVCYERVEARLRSRSMTASS